MRRWLGGVRCAIWGAGLAACACNTGGGGAGAVGGGDGNGGTNGNQLTGGDQSGLVPGASADSNTPADGVGVGGNGASAGDGNAVGATDGNVVGGGLAGGNAVLARDPNFMVDERYAYSFVGRFDLSNPNAVRFNWPGSRIGIAFTGTSLSVVLRDTGYDTFNVQVDGNDYASPADAFGQTASAALVPCKPVAQVPAWDGNSVPGCILAVPSSTTNVRLQTVYPVVTDLPPGNHVAWITKRSEFLQAGTAGTTTFFGVRLDANATLLPAPAYRKRRLEFVGDSSFTGFGAAQRNPCGYTSRNSDAERSIPAYVAKYVRAEHVNISSSGQGVYQSYYDYNGDHNLPTLYRQTVGLDKTATKAWAFDDAVDAIVLSAGGDDLWGAPGSGKFENNNAAVTTDATENFIAAYVRWLEEMRRLRPNATIFVTLTYGAFANDYVLLGGALQQAVGQRNAAGDPNVVYYTYFPANDPVRNPKGYTNLGDVTTHEQMWLGCTGHPSPMVAQYFGALLGDFVAKRMGYTDAGP